MQFADVNLGTADMDACLQQMVTILMSRRMLRLQMQSDVCPSCIMDNLECWFFKSRCSRGSGGEDLQAK
jgi:hypothetical protein